MGNKIRDNFVEHMELPLEAERLTHLSLLPVQDGSRLSTEIIAPLIQHLIFLQLFQVLLFSLADRVQSWPLHT